MDPQETVPQRAVPQKAVPQKAVSQKAVPQKAVPQKTVPQKAVPQKAVSQKAVPQKAVSQKAVPHKAVSQKAVPPKAVPQKAVSQKAVPPKAVPRETVPHKSGVHGASGDGVRARTSTRDSGAAVDPISDITQSLGGLTLGSMRPSLPEATADHGDGAAIEVVFDLETTGLNIYKDPKADIIQIAAVYTGRTFSRYIAPLSGGIPRLITKITRISWRDGIMFSDDKKVVHTTLSSAMAAFIEFLPTNCILVAHNGHKFDRPLLLRHLMDCRLIPAFQKKVVGFLDTLPLAKEVYPGRKKNELTGQGPYKQEALLQDILGVSYDAHNAIADVSALAQLLEDMNRKGYEKNHTVSLSEALAQLEQKLSERR